MQLTNPIGLWATLAYTTTAMPRFGGAYHGDSISIHVPSNTTSHSPTATGTRGRVPLATGTQSKSAVVHGLNEDLLPNHVKKINHCHELCSLEAQTCSLAVPTDDKFW